MADVKITALTVLTAADPINDAIPIVDVSDNSMAASGTTKRISVNNILGASGTATLASATITGDLTVDTNTLKVVSSTDSIGVGFTPSAWAGGRKAIQIGSPAQIVSSDLTLEIGSNWWNDGTNYKYTVNNPACLYAPSNGSHVWYNAPSGFAAGTTIGWNTLMTLNSTGLGVGVASPAQKLDVDGNIRMSGVSGGTRYLLLNADNTYTGSLTIQSGGGSSSFGAATILYGNSHATYPGGVWIGRSSGSTGPIMFGTGGITPSTIQMTLDSSGNVGVGVTPSAWNNSYNVLEIGQNGSISGRTATNNQVDIVSNGYREAGGAWVYKLATSNAAARYLIDGSVGGHFWYSGVAGTAGNTIAGFSAASMTLTTGGDLLVGTTSGTYHTFRKNVATDVGNVVFEIQGTGGGTSSIYYSVSGYNANAANAASKFGRDGVTLRSINAGGTVNASGADYAEYMVKCSDFVLAKGDVAGIDANGKLTNVFADAVSFVVKSTDPSYVGNDKWGVDLEGDALEAARQLVDRIAFAGQVPVNVTGAKAGDYIVPVVNGTGIKGQAVSNPTFEQYQLAVGKVISIDADGRARIIVKVA